MGGRIKKMCEELFSKQITKKVEKKNLNKTTNWRINPQTQWN